MKRMGVLTLVLVLRSGLLKYAYADQEHGARRDYDMGYGMHGGMGPGMEGMGYGTGPGMMPLWDSMPESKRKQIEQLHRSIGPAMMRKTAETRDSGLQLRKIMHEFSINQKASEEQWSKLNRARGEGYKLRLGMMTQMQKILGRELWGTVTARYRQ